MLATSKHGHCQHLAYQPPPPKDPLDLSRVWVDKENQTCWVENEDWNSSHKFNKVQLARVPNVDSKPPREVSTQCSCLPNFAKANHFMWLYFRKKKTGETSRTWPFYLRIEFQYSHNPSHPFVLPLKKHAIFTISTLRSPTRFRASEATYIRFKAKLSVKRPATCDTWKDTNMAILGCCHVIFLKIKGGWKQRFSEISKDGSLVYKWWSLMIGNCSDCVWVKHQHSRHIGHHLCTSKLENTSSLNCLETILSGKFLQSTELMDGIDLSMQYIPYLICR